MQAFDPRNPPVRYAPRVLIGAAGLSVLALSWQLTVRAPAATLSMAGSAVAALHTRSFAQAGGQPAGSAPEQLTTRIAPGETLQQTLTRLGVGPADAAQAAHALGADRERAGAEAGLAVRATVVRSGDRSKPARLIGLWLRTGPASTLSLSRTFDGALSLRRSSDEAAAEPAVVQGRLSDSLYASALAAGAPPALAAQVVRLFSHKLDFSRDIHPGEQLRLVFDRKAMASGPTADPGELLYAEIDADGRATRFYRFTPAGASGPQYFDGTGRNIRSLLLRTPLDGARVSSGFGMRLHPILGYSRMHAGIDFAAPVGTPILAAGDGVVTEARWATGYGRWLEIRHDAQWATGYGHLSGWAVRPGQRVRQGEVVGYVGASGLATGPHLHYEVMFDGRKIDPAGAALPQGASLEGSELVAFEQQKARIDQLLGEAPDLGEPRLVRAEAPHAPERLDGLRLAMR